MPAFDRDQRRLVSQGVQLTAAPDDCAPGKWPVLFNVRSTVSGELQPRLGFDLITGAATGFPLHTLARFDDPTTFAAYPRALVAGSDEFLRVWSLDAAGTAIGTLFINDSGYSGDPLCLAAVNPPNSPQPWLYVSDSVKIRKYRSALGTSAATYTTDPIGLAAPIDAPQAELDQLHLNLLEAFDALLLGWLAINGEIVMGATVDRVNTTINSILYDSGLNVGYASVVPVDITGISEGMVITFDAGGINEYAVVTKLTIAVATTTIAAIIYDTGVTGPCTIQPTASLGVGQLDSPTVDDYIRRWQIDAVHQLPSQNGPRAVAPRRNAVDSFDRPSVAPSPSLTRIRQIDFPVDCVITLGGTETVRILSVAIGPDGIQSFRCITTGTHAAGEAIVGQAAFRAFTTSTYGAGTTLTDKAYRGVITPVASGSVYIASTGIKTSPFTSAGDYDLSLIDGRATLDQDDLRLAIRFSNCTNVSTVRVYFDVDPAEDFLRNYYFFEWRANDIIAAIQATNAAAVSTLQDVRGTVIAKNQLNGPPAGSRIPNAQQPKDQAPIAPGKPLADNSTSAQLALGNNQWLELHCKIKDLVHVGTNTALTLADVVAAEIIVAIADAPSAATVTVDFDGLSLTGGYSPDTGVLGHPYVYRYRYRNTNTGAASNWSPPTRAGVIPQRQQILLTGAAPTEADQHVNAVDWARFGGALPAWTVVGSVPYIAGSGDPTFSDNFADADIVGSEQIQLLNMQPWPMQDLPREGTLDVAGNAVSRVSGDPFNTSWAPGSTIIINNQAYTLYAQPLDTDRLFVNENIGTGTAVSFRVPGATLVSQPAPTLWGGTIQGQTFLFSIDAIDPGRLRWTEPNNPEASREANNLEVTASSEPLQNGYIWDGVPFVASTENHYVLNINPGNAISAFRADVTACGKGFWTPWAFAIAPEGVYFLAKDGIYLTTGGSPAQSITDADLYPMFPHEGVESQALVNSFLAYNPPNMALTERLRLSYIDGWLYFDYVDMLGYAHTLAYHAATQSWWADYTTGLSGGAGSAGGVTCRMAGVGIDVHQMLVGAYDGQVYVPGTNDLDWQTAFTCTAQHVINQKDARRQKLYRDLMLDSIIDGALTVGYGVDNVETNTEALTGGATRSQQVIPINTQLGLFGTNLQIRYSWVSNVAQPTLFVEDIGFQPAPELTNNWLSGPTTHGLRQYQQAYRALIAYRSFTEVTLSVYVDNVVYEYTLPSTAGQYQKREVVLQAVKGLTFQWGMQTVPDDNPTGFQLFNEDCEFWLQPWGVPGGYLTAKVF